jgi:hypothetical protein
MYRHINARLVNKLKNTERKQYWPNLRYYPSICMEGLRRRVKTLSQYKRTEGVDLRTRIRSANYLTGSFGKVVSEGILKEQGVTREPHSGG